MKRCTRLSKDHSRAAHILVRLAELGTSMASRTALLDNSLYDFLQTPVVILVTRDPWWFPDMQMPGMAKDVVRQIFVSFETFVHGHMKAAKHNSDKP